MRKLFLGLLTVSLVCWAGGQALAAHSDHGCHNCHVPHHAGDPTDPSDYGVPLWSTVQNADGLPTFTLYSSQTFDALAPGITQPDGPSKMCLGCHDGSYDYFKIVKPTSSAIFQVGDLARSHPVSFPYTSALAAKVLDGGLRDPSVAMSGLGGTITQDLLDAKGKMQCTSCHDVHLTGKGTDMLRYDWNPISPGVNDQQMCRVCHNK